MDFLNGSSLGERIVKAGAKAKPGPKKKKQEKTQEIDAKKPLFLIETARKLPANWLSPRLEGFI